MSAKTKSKTRGSADRAVDSIIKNWRQGKRPLSLAIDDFRFEINDDASFQILLDLLERLENIAAIQKGLDDFEAGRSLSLDELKQKVRHGIRR